MRVATSSTEFEPRAQILEADLREGRTIRASSLEEPPEEPPSRLGV